MIDIDWRKLRSLSGSQNKAFEELCCQLAEYEKKPADSTFTRKGTPDAGVECFISLPNQTEWGWQAKYFLSMGTKQWSQLDDSIQTALEKHPKLVKYIVCLPLDLPDARRKEQKSALKKWNDRVKKWRTWATKMGMEVQFEYWGSYQILERLSREEHKGRFFFWFGKEYFSQSWFETRLTKAIAVAGPRYTPPIHVELPIVQYFEALVRNSEFFGRIKQIFQDTKNEYSRINNQNQDNSLNKLISDLDVKTEHFFDTLSTLTNSLTKPLPWSSITEQTEQLLKIATDCMQQLREVEQLKSKLSNSNPNKTFQNDRLYLNRFVWKIREVRNFSKNLQAKLSNLPALLLCGEAGHGKTHLFCDIASQRMKAGLPTILLMGQRFHQSEPWNQIIQQLGLPVATTPDELLGALQAMAEVTNSKALIMIDALNEGEGKKIWLNSLPAMLETIARYPWVSLAVSVRSSYENVIVEQNLIDTRLIRIEHGGFADYEYQATRIFFDYYGIAQPSVPLLTPEFQNPLFLKLYCEGLQKTNSPTPPTGLQGITTTFEFFINAVNQKLSGHGLCDFNPKRQIVREAIHSIAKTMIKQQTNRLSIDIAEQTLNEVLPTQGYENSLYRHLISEGVLIENNHYDTQTNGWKEVVQFAYERFSDHIITQHLLDKHSDTSSLQHELTSGQSLAFLVENEWWYQGIIEALCIQIPERFSKEFPEIVPMMAESDSVGQAFIQSLIWRNPQACTDSTLDYLNTFTDQLYDGHDQLLNALLTVAINPEHPYNADFLHTRLMNDEMAKRDSYWSIFLHEQYNTQNAIDRLVDWAFSTEDKGHICDEAIRLCGMALVWFLTTSNRFLRDRATKALVNLLTSRIPVLLKIMASFRDINDLYVAERLYAVAYGCALRTINDEQIGTLAQTIYNWKFCDNRPPPHILLRDYARGVIEYALYKKIELDIDVDKIRPPYNSEWLDIPTEEALQQYKVPLTSYDSGNNVWAQQRIIHSVMSDDFARYVIGTNSGSTSSHWLSLPLSEPLWRSSQEIYEEIVDSLEDELRSKWTEIANNYREFLIYKRLTQIQNLDQSLGLDDVSETFGNLKPEQVLEELCNQLNSEIHKFICLLSDNQKGLFESVVLPHLINPSTTDTESYFDLSLIQRWIVKRVFDLGWTAERFGDFDKYISHNNFREARKAERIGKKYQWLAYYEFLARVADNFQYRNSFSYESTLNRYDGPWQLGIRDIDPSSLLKKTASGDHWQETTSNWWCTTMYQNWYSISDDVVWMQEISDLPDIPSLLEVTKPDDKSEWFVLSGFYRWQQPILPEEKAYGIAKRDMWYILNGYLVRQADYDELYQWAIKQNFMERWMPEGLNFHSIHLGEFYWSSTYTYYTDPNQDYLGVWQPGGDENRRIPKPVLPLIQTYTRETGGFDCSVDETFSIIMPNQFIVKQMGLEWKGYEGKFFDKTGTLIAFDPSVSEKGLQTLLIRKEAFVSFLNKNEYGVLWTVSGEKQLIGGRFGPQGWKGKLEINGAYRWSSNQFEGQITPCFETPQEQD